MQDLGSDYEPSGSSPFPTFPERGAAEGRRMKEHLEGPSLSLAQFSRKGHISVPRALFQEGSPHSLNITGSEGTS